MTILSDIIAFKFFMDVYKMLLELFLTFAYIGMFAFGGGFVMLPIFEREFAKKRKWLSKEDVTDLFATAQCLPGILSCNFAVFVGYKQKGVSGGIAAALGMVTPSIVIILIIASFLSAFTDIEIVSKAFIGIRVCVCILIFNVVIKLWKQSIADKLAIVIFTVVFLITVFTGFPVAVLIILSGAFGIAISTIRKQAAKEGK